MSGQTGSLPLGYIATIVTDSVRTMTFSWLEDVAEDTAKYFPTFGPVSGAFKIGELAFSAWDGSSQSTAANIVPAIGVASGGFLTGELGAATVLAGFAVAGVTAPFWAVAAVTVTLGYLGTKLTEAGYDALADSDVFSNTATSVAAALGTLSSSISAEYNSLASNLEQGIAAGETSLSSLVDSLSSLLSSGLSNESTQLGSFLGSLGIDAGSINLGLSDDLDSIDNWLRLAATNLSSDATLSMAQQEDSFASFLSGNASIVPTDFLALGQSDLDYSLGTSSVLADGITFNASGTNGSFSLSDDNNGDEVANFYSGTFSATGQIAQNSAGQTVVTNIGTDGSETITSYAMIGSVSSLIETDYTSPDGSSTITNISSTGSTISTAYSGPDGSGYAESQIITIIDGKYSATVELNQLELTFPSVRAGDADGYYETLSVSYLGGNTPIAVDQPFLEIFGQNFIADYPSEISLGSNSTEGYLTDSVFSQVLGGNNVVAQVPITVEDGNGRATVISTLTLEQKIYAEANPIINIGTSADYDYDFGIVHVGDTGASTSIEGTIVNDPFGTFADSLIVDLGSSTENFSESGGLVTMAIGESSIVNLSINTGQAGDFYENVGPTIAISHDPDLPDMTLDMPQFSLFGEVYSYAAPIFIENDNIGSLVQNGSLWSINLGNIKKSDSDDELNILIDNANKVDADNLSGSFDMSGTGFEVFDADPFNYDTYLYIDVEEGGVGSHAETIVLHPDSWNSSGYDGALPDQTLVITDNILCYIAGTRILTPRGEVTVENLAIGESVITNDGDEEAIVWIGRRAIDLTRHCSPDLAMPVMITRGALGEDVPRRDLAVSPDHALYLGSHLIPAKALINGFTVLQVWRPSVIYYHIELRRHAVMFAEGAPAESYLDTGNRAAFENGGVLMVLHPDFAQSRRKSEGCAPFAEEGAPVQEARQRILDRAGIKTTMEPDVKIQYCDGTAIIESRSAVPGFLTADPRDRRILGVKVASLSIEGEDIALNHPKLIEGWHDVEPDGRWTNGHAKIPAELLKGYQVEVKLTSTLCYPLEGRNILPIANTA